ACALGALTLGFGWTFSDTRAETDLREQCEQRSRALGVRAPVWEAAVATPPPPADPCARSQRTAALTLVAVLEQFPDLPTLGSALIRGSAWTTAPSLRSAPGPS